MTPYQSLLLLTLMTLATGCAAQLSSRGLPGPAPASRAPALDRSHFSRDPQGQLTEEQLQRILAAPVDLAFPARLGVVPVRAASDRSGPSPDLGDVPRGAGILARELKGSQYFPVVTEVLPIPSGALGMEALREVAARYQLRYLLLYREATVHRVRANPVTALFLTIVGALFLPGRTLEVDGHLEASLLDVKTGVLLLTVRRAVRARQLTNLWYPDDKLRDLQRRLAARFVPELAADARSRLARLHELVQAERRGAPPVAGSAGPAVRTPN